MSNNAKHDTTKKEQSPTYGLIQEVAIGEILSTQMLNENQIVVEDRKSER